MHNSKSLFINISFTFISSWIQTGDRLIEPLFVWVYAFFVVGITMAFFASRTVRAGQLLGARLRAASPLTAAAAASASRVRDTAELAAAEAGPQQNKKEFAFAAITACVGAAAFFSAWGPGYSSQPVLLQEAPKGALDPNTWIHFKLEKIEQLSHNTKMLRFGFDDANAVSGLSVASCLLTRARIGNEGKDGKPNYVIRPYTPVTSPDVKGYFDLVVKIYPEGKMTQHMAKLGVGDTLEVKGPLPKIPYSPNMKRHIGMVAGGTGITPMFQVIDAILSNESDMTQISLVYANVSPDDILLKKTLDDLAASHPNFKVFYVVNNPTANWKGGVGFTTYDTIVKALPPPSDDTLILVCGPPGMMKAISGDKESPKNQGELTGLLKSAGYSEHQVFKF
ncbi:cytochrome-b5 reductase [Marchantia polymorpha subsp. ruderalis]|uniref:NADH-cytochrome b5 reductase n=4 Tax=Marchantia polymorpha TaxID=3197 RepID=A0AAF6BNX1_MARPO|nr:hypothetical protein MARPO_0097s0074 [Marchantia polymorpha]BBN13705.1 hypothetical protein Mp_6g05680 [Marchantia polymorpha subsp. ruderalis]|eukprot:PTQ32604.1 hypothetical protein MARPO_0097s0074 [Marchantia polymorpha]